MHTANLERIQSDLNEALEQVKICRIMRAAMDHILQLSDGDNELHQDAECRFDDAMTELIACIARLAGAVGIDAGQIMAAVSK